ncbi:MAG: nucleotidyltransferase family protein [Prolixibacteraceae bacterium]|jgi:hypothetical protein|nr:nucleotidyltransferase family protein [Prolixibacteraceae bacterium]
MRDTLLKDRQYLRKRHRLSHQQIDTWLGENRSTEFINDKLKQLELVRQFLNITDKFGNKGIPFISIKGPLLSLRLYGDPTVRISCDIDLLIEKKYLDKTVALMLSEGYEFVDNFVWPAENYKQEIFALNYHHIVFYSRILNLRVEIHWVLTRILAVSMKTFKQIIADNLTTIRYANRSFVVLNKETELLYLLIHGANHRWKRLKWLVDIHEYLKQEIDVVLLNKLIGQFKASRIIAQANFFLDKYFQSQLPVSGNKRIPKRLLIFTDKNIENREISLISSLEDRLNNFWYFWLLSSNINYKLNWFIVTIARVGNVYNIKVANVFYRPYSFIKRRIFNV